jgi:hypothetical protein
VNDLEEHSSHVRVVTSMNDEEIVSLAKNNLTPDLGSRSGSGDWSASSSPPKERRPPLVMSLINFLNNDESH